MALLDELNFQIRMEQIKRRITALEKEILPRSRKPQRKPRQVAKPKGKK